MFGTLKKRLKNWVSKNEEATAEEIKKKSISKKRNTRKNKGKIRDIEKGDKKESSKEKKSFFSKLKKERREIIKKPVEGKSIFSKFQRILDEEKFEELFQELQIILLQNNVAYEAVEEIETSLKRSLVGKILKEIDLASELKSSIQNLLINPPDFIKQIKASKSKPFIILFSGINGSGKTTTIAKIAYYLQKNSLSVCLAAADTFRAAAIQQLEVHGQNLKVPVIKKDYGSDPASVGFDAVKYATKHNLDVVLIDTAGRMQNSDTLMKEIEKINKVTKPNMKIFLGESITGNDATLQALVFSDSIDISGIILSKADIDEKGGTAISVAHVTNKPILFLGTGQEYKDLEVFDKEKLIEKLGL